MSSELVRRSFESAGLWIPGESKSARRQKMLDDYHSHPALSSGKLGTLAGSPRLFEGKYIKRDVETEVTENMEFGTAAHLALLELSKIDTYVKQIPDEVLTTNGQRRGRRWDEWASIHSEFICLKRNDVSRLFRLVEAVYRHTLARTLLEAAGDVESPYYWTEAGIDCRSLCDKQIAGKPIIVDLKMVADISLSGFRRSIDRYRYNLQDAHYTAGLAHQMAIDPNQVLFYFITIESKAPHRVRVREIDPNDRASSRQLRLQLLNDYSKRMINGDWSDREEHEVSIVRLNRAAFEFDSVTDDEEHGEQYVISE